LALVGSFSAKFFYLCDELVNARHRSVFLTQRSNHIIPRMIVGLFAANVNRILAIISKIDGRVAKDSLHSHTG
jgi:hypothetical protein